MRKLLDDDVDTTVYLVEYLLVLCKFFFVFSKSLYAQIYQLVRCITYCSFFNDNVLWVYWLLIWRNCFINLLLIIRGLWFLWCVLWILFEWLIPTYGFVKCNFDELLYCKKWTIKNTFVNQPAKCLCLASKKLIFKLNPKLCQNDYFHLLHYW